MGTSLTDQQVIAKLLPERIDRLRKVTGVPVVLGGLARRDNRGLQLVVVRLVGTVGDTLRGLIVQSGRGLGGYVLQQEAPLRLDDYFNTSLITHEYDEAVQAERLRSIFAVPVPIGGEVRCVLFGAVRNSHPIGDRALKGAAVVAQQLSADVDEQLRGRSREAGRRSALEELDAVIRETTDRRIRARLVRIHDELTGRSSSPEVRRMLAPREIDVLCLVEVGLSNLEIAVRLGLGVETVRSYLRSAMRRLEVHNRTAAAHRARLGGMLGARTGRDEMSQV